MSQTRDWLEQDGVDVDRLARDAAALLTMQLRIDLRASVIMAAALAAASLVWSARWGLVIAGAILVMAGVRQIGLPAMRRGNLFNAIAWTAVGTWGIAIIVVWIVPEVMPLMILNLVSPLINVTTYMSEATTQKFTTAALGVAMVLGLLGFAQDGTGLIDEAPRWFISGFIILTLMAHVHLVVRNIQASTRVRNRAMQALSTTNDRLGLVTDDLRESRRRVVLAGDRERVRIERNIHDGAQQVLISLAIRLKLLAEESQGGTPPAPEVLTELHHGVDAAIQELRDLSHGIYPALLVQGGLRDALVNAAKRSSREVLVDVPTDIDLATDDQAAVYFVCVEALQNALKHAGADAIVSLVVATRNDELVFEVRDDGLGFDPALVSQSSGLLNMADRVAALGGQLVIDSAPGSGTSVRGSIPRSVSVT